MQSSKAMSKAFMGSVCRFSRGGGISKDRPSLFDRLLFYTSDRSLGRAR